MSGPPRERRIDATYAGIPISGVSIAGRETFFHLPTFRIAFDVGRCPTDLVPVTRLFLSHAHLDHGAGVAYWASQRTLSRMAGGVVHTTPEAVDGWRRLLALHAELEGVDRYDARVEPLAPGATVTLRKDACVTAFRVDHRVPGLGFLLSERRNQLRPEFQGRSREEIRDASAAGRQVAESAELPLVAYSGDTAKGIFDLAPKEVFRAKVFLLECTFLEPAHLEKAAGWGHLHLSEIAERAETFENEVLVLTHLTLRTSPEEIRRQMSRQLPASLAKRTVAFLA
ncbi:MAG TPA: MBL fold metallo-hydrolase [Thermoanaerobaculia bacterium]|nr:MBL fold metallo-hydrolase [Thermoanaerobaculia bacterium]